VVWKLSNGVVQSLVVLNKQPGLVFEKLFIILVPPLAASFIFPLTFSTRTPPPVTLFVVAVVSVFLGIVVAMLAGSLAEPIARCPAHVLRVGYGFQMIRVHTNPVVAYMV